MTTKHVFCLSSFLFVFNCFFCPLVPMWTLKKLGGPLKTHVDLKKSQTRSWTLKNPALDLKNPVPDLCSKRATSRAYYYRCASIA